MFYAPVRYDSAQYSEIVEEAGESFISWFKYLSMLRKKKGIE